MNAGLVFVVVFAAFVSLSVVALLKRYRRCPSDKILVIFGRTREEGAKCLHGGAAFVWPLWQDYSYLDLAPLTIDVALQGALTHDNIRISAPSSFTVGIGSEPELMKAAAERLLELEMIDVRRIAEGIIYGQFRSIVAMMDLEEINNNREKLRTTLSDTIGTELAKIGMRLINIDIRDIEDESGYVKALGEKTAADAINQARIDVARARKETDIAISLAEKETRVGVMTSEAEAAKGENIAKQIQAFSEAELCAKMAEANTATYRAETEAENARRERDKASRQADTLPKVEVERERKMIESDVLVEQQKREGLAEGERVRNEMLGRAAGMKAIYDVNSEGITKLLAATSGDAGAALMLMLHDRLPDFLALQAQAAGVDDKSEKMVNLLPITNLFRMPDVVGSDTATRPEKGETLEADGEKN